MLRRPLTLCGSNTLQILCGARRVSRRATRVLTQERQAPVVGRGKPQLASHGAPTRGPRVETRATGKINNRSIGNSKKVVRNAGHGTRTTRSGSSVEKKRAVDTKRTVATSPIRKATGGATGKETRRKRPHAHTVQKMKYNKRVAAIAKLWRMQKKKNTSKVSTKHSKK